VKENDIGAFFRSGLFVLQGGEESKTPKNIQDGERSVDWLAGVLLVQLPRRL
jgi:hypothetical protein